MEDLTEMGFWEYSYTKHVSVKAVLLDKTPVLI